MISTYQVELPEFNIKSSPRAWLFAALFYGLGDGLTTLYIFSSPEFVEMNPGLRAVGPVGLIILKIVLLLVSLQMYSWVKQARIELPHRETVPVTWNVTLGLLGVYATVHNLAVFL